VDWRLTSGPRVESEMKRIFSWRVMAEIVVFTGADAVIALLTDRFEALLWKPQRQTHLHRPAFRWVSP